MIVNGSEFTANTRQIYPGSPDLRTIVSENGERWLAFRKKLKPKYLIVWRDIALCYGMIIAALMTACALNGSLGNGVALMTAPLFGLWIGYWIHSVACFGHEAAHHNLAPRPWLNDWLANWFAMSLIGLEAGFYRKIHWAHHLYLGSHRDTEVSYQNHPSPRFLIEIFTGIYLFKVLLSYGSTRANKSTGLRPDSRSQLRLLCALIRTVTIHAVILAALVAARWYGAVAAWLAAFVAFAAFAVLRQILEHRSNDASPEVDYGRVEQGPTNRLFATSFVSRTFGNAGFNRHLLHHWDPAISYTCFDEMEAFFKRSNVAAQLETARTTYWSALRRLWSGRNRYDLQRRNHVMSGMSGQQRDHLRQSA